MNRLPLIDELIADKAGFMQNKVEINGKWYAAKPLPYYGWHNTILRVKSAWAVLIGKAIAVQYAEDCAALAARKADVSLTDEGNKGQVVDSSGCDHCNSPLFAGIRCRICGRKADGNGGEES